ncbi:hypothetical protein ACFXAZ_10100 [Streptomyces sp. NPDC059477]|uniref:hypothetical protein n=1 Tax=Streptomyces sp. NPDC059477 TaxID=3346847 RepID=UPI0036942461
MSVEPDGYDGRDGSGGRDGYDGRDGFAGAYDALDPLLAVLMDDPLPAEARADAAFMAEYRAASADVTVLREQLGHIATALTEPQPQPQPRPAPLPLRPRRRPFALVLGGLAAVCAAVLLAGLGWIVVQSGAGLGADDAAAGSSSDKAAAEDGGSVEDGDENQASSALGSPGYLACARLVVEGEVTAVRPEPGGGALDRITLDVTRYLKPAQGERQITFTMSRDSEPRLTQGDHTLIVIRTDAIAPDLWVVGEQDIVPGRELITETLPRAEGLPCE